MTIELSNQEIDWLCRALENSKFDICDDCFWLRERFKAVNEDQPSTVDLCWKACGKCRRGRKELESKLKHLYPEES